jgi:glycoside/pentoside/hexuronide:cation symporter, GPH family
MDPASGLTRRVGVGWAIGELGIATYIGITMSYLLFYLTQALGISPVWAGLALLIPRLWDALIDPLVGAISDRTRSRMGRRRPFLLVGGLTFGVMFAFLFQAPADASEGVKIAYVIALYLLTSTAFTFYDVPYSSMAAEMTTDYRVRTRLTGFKMVAARIGILVAVIAAPLLFNSQETLVQGFAVMGMVAGAYMVLSGLWAFLATRDAPQIVRPAEPFDLRAEYRALRENRPFLILWTTFLFQNFAIGASATTLIYLVIFVMKIDAALVGAMVATSAVGAMVATPFWVRLAQYGKQKAYAAGIVGAATLSLLMLFMPAGLPAALFVALFLIGLVDGGTQLCPNAMVPDTVEYDEERTGQRREGTIFGTWLLCRKLGMAMGAFIASLFLSAFGFVAGADAAAQGENALLGIRLSYTLVPCVLWVCAFFVLRAYPLTEARFEELKRNISAARASKETA